MKNLIAVLCFTIVIIAAFFVFKGMWQQGQYMLLLAIYLRMHA